MTVEGLLRGKEGENGRNRNGRFINTSEICRSLLGQRIMHNARRSGTDERCARRKVARCIGDGGPVMFPSRH